jgi:hypothetical protein
MRRNSVNHGAARKARFSPRPRWHGRWRRSVVGAVEEDRRAGLIQGPVALLGGGIGGLHAFGAGVEGWGPGGLLVAGGARAATERAEGARCRRGKGKEGPGWGTECQTALSGSEDPSPQV